MKCILGTKLGMTQLFKDDGTVVPVTRVQAGPCVITQVKTKGKDNVSAVQIGFGEQKAFRLSKALQGHLKNSKPVKHMRDVRVEADDHGLKTGDTYTVAVFEAGDKVQVTGVSKGKGFQGVMKRHGFKGGQMTHGNKDQQRMPGSIGATGPARVFKGMRMGGHMGDDQVTVKNLEIIEVKAEDNELYIKGALPGARGGVVMIYTPDGTIDVSTAVVAEEMDQAPAEEVKEPVEAEKTEEKSETVDAPEATEETPVEEKEEVKEAEEAKSDDKPEDTK